MNIVKWTIDVASTNPQPMTAKIMQQEDCTFAINYNRLGNPLDLSNANVQVFYQSQDMLNSWYELDNQAINAVSGEDNNTISFDWSHVNDNGNKRYIIYVRVELDDKISYRACVAINMMPSPNFVPSIIDAPVRFLDFDVIEYSNAPWVLPVDIDTAINTAVEALPPRRTDDDIKNVMAPTINDIQEDITTLETDKADKVDVDNDIAGLSTVYLGINDKAVSAVTAEYAEDAGRAYHADNAVNAGVAGTAEIAMFANNAGTVNDFTVETNVPDDAVFTDTIVDISGKADTTALTSHTGNSSNPHDVTPAQIGAAAVSDLVLKADKVLPYTPLTGANVTVSPSHSYTWETTAGTNTLTVSGFTEGVDASCSMIITMFEGDTVAASGLTFVDELEVGVNHCFIRQMPTGEPQLFVSYAKPFTPEQLERLEQYGDMDIVESPDAWFVFDSGTKTIIGFNYDEGRENVVIPWEIGGVAVEAIGESVFYSENGAGSPVETVIGPKTVLSIGNGAFAYCTSFTSMSLPAATLIGAYAFVGCTSLTSVSLPAATLIGAYAFYGCTSLTSVSLPAATLIRDSAFRDCYLLTSVYFGTAKPTEGSDVFNSESDPINVTIYYPTGASAWSDVTTWCEKPTAPYTPPAP